MSAELTPIQQRLEDFRQQGRVQAGSLIVSVFGDAVMPRGSRIWLGSLIRLLEPLELNERLIRTSVFRLAKEEWLCSEPAGRRTDYLLAPAGQRRFAEASRHIYAARAPQWDRRWRLTPQGFLLSNQLIGALLEVQEKASLSELMPKAKENFQRKPGSEE